MCSQYHMFMVSMRSTCTFVFLYLLYLIYFFESYLCWFKLKSQSFFLLLLLLLIIIVCIFVSLFYFFVFFFVLICLIRAIVNILSASLLILRINNNFLKIKFYSLNLFPYAKSSLIFLNCLKNKNCEKHSYKI